MQNILTISKKDHDLYNSPFSDHGGSIRGRHRNKSRAESGA